MMQGNCIAQHFEISYKSFTFFRDTFAVDELKACQNSSSSRRQSSGNEAIQKPSNGSDLHDDQLVTLTKYVVGAKANPPKNPRRSWKKGNVKATNAVKTEETNPHIRKQKNSG